MIKKKKNKKMASHLKTVVWIPNASLQIIMINTFPLHKFII